MRGEGSQRPSLELRLRFPPKKRQSLIRTDEKIAAMGKSTDTRRDTVKLAKSNLKAIILDTGDIESKYCIRPTSSMRVWWDLALLVTVCVYVGINKSLVNHPK